MSFFLKISGLVVLLIGIGFAKAEQPLPADAIKETVLPITEETTSVTLEEVIKRIMLDTKNKVLAAKTEVVAGKKTHVIKVLTSAGHIQYIKIDAVTGKTPEKTNK